MEPVEENLPARRPGPPMVVSPLGSEPDEEHLAPALVPKPTAARTDSSGAAATARNAPDLSRRRRGLGFVTTNACTECRTKRAKCDGQRPCTRCKFRKRDAKCIYATPVRQSKENLRDEIEQLKRQGGNSDSVFAALGQPELKEEVLTRLGHGQSVESISEWLARTLPSGGNAFPTPSSIGDLPRGPSGAAILLNPSATSPHEPTGPELGTVNPVPSHSQSTSQDSSQNTPWGGGPFSSRGNCNPDTMNWSSDTVQGGRQSTLGSRLESYGLSDDQHRLAKQDELPTPNILGMNLSPRVWTNITLDSNLIQHLLSLYFCWEYPIFASLSKEHFLMDFQDGHDRFCSEILVNALLALGCRFSNRLDANENPNDPYSSGDHFFKESKRLLLQEGNSHKLTTIQALGIMSIREASCGRGSGSWYYAGQSIHLAIEMGLHQANDDTGDEEEIAVRVATFWGCFALDQVWSLAIGSLPQGSYFPNLPPKPPIISDKEAILWVPYTDDGHLLQGSGKQQSNVQSVFQCSCELGKLIHQTLYVLHSPGQPLTSQGLLEIYTLYLNWYDKVPEILRLGNNYTPAVLFTHMYYHFAILLLFQPLIRLRIVGSSVSPRNMCLQAANTIQGLLRSYSQLYTLRRTPSFIPYFVLMSTTTHLAIGALSLATPQASVPNELSEGGQPELQQVPATGKIDLHVAEAINQGIADLTEMAPCHQFAEQALNILLHLSKQWNVDLGVRNWQKEGAGDDSRTAWGTRPVNPSFFSPNVNEQVRSWGTAFGAGRQLEVRAEATEPTPQMINALENPLFWPFLRHGGPSVPSGPLPADSGFELL